LPKLWYFYVLHQLHRPICAALIFLSVTTWTLL